MNFVYRVCEILILFYLMAAEAVAIESNDTFRAMDSNVSRVETPQSIYFTFWSPKNEDLIAKYHGELRPVLSFQFDRKTGKPIGIASFHYDVNKKTEKVDQTIRFLKINEITDHIKYAVDADSAKEEFDKIRWQVVVDKIQNFPDFISPTRDKLISYESAWKEMDQLSKQSTAAGLWTETASDILRGYGFLDPIQMSVRNSPRPINQSKKIKIVYLGVTHWVPENEQGPTAFGEIVRSQFAVAKYLEAHPEGLVFLEAFSDPVQLKSSRVKTDKSAFRSGLPGTLEDLDPGQEVILAADGGPIILHVSNQGAARLHGCFTPDELATIESKKAEFDIRRKNLKTEEEKQKYLKDYDDFVMVQRDKWVAKNVLNFIQSSEYHGEVIYLPFGAAHDFSPYFNSKDHPEIEFESFNFSQSFGRKIDSAAEIKALFDQIDQKCPPPATQPTN